MVDLWLPWFNYRDQGIFLCVFYFIFCSKTFILIFVRGRPTKKCLSYIAEDDPSTLILCIIIIISCCANCAFIIIVIILGVNRGLFHKKMLRKVWIKVQNLT